MQPGPDSIGIVAISHGCTGVAARACGLVGLEPTRVSPSQLVRDGVSLNWWSFNQNLINNVLYRLLKSSKIGPHGFVIAELWML